MGTLARRPPWFEMVLSKVLDYIPVILTRSALTDQSPDTEVRLGCEGRRMIEYLKVEESHKDYTDLDHLRVSEWAGVDLANGQVQLLYHSQEMQQKTHRITDVHS